MTTTTHLPHDRDQDGRGLQLLRCRAHADPAETDDLVLEEGTVLWVDVPAGADPVVVAGRLGSLHPSLTAARVTDLLERDPLARVEECADGVRHVTMVGIGLPDRWPDPDAAHHELDFQMIEVVVGEGWLVTCWHPSRHFDGSPGQDRDGEPVLRELLHESASRWAEAGRTTAGDLATCLAESLARRYKHVYRALDLWLQQWEQRVHVTEQIDKQDRDELKQLLSLVNEARRNLAAFNNSRSLTGDGRWFPGADPALDKGADEMLDKALDRLRTLFEGIRADLDLVCMETLAHQAEIAEKRAASERKFQDGVGRITALLLVPTLIAGIFGANTWLPGGGKTSGFGEMLALMVLASALVYWAIVRQPREQEPGA